MQSTHCCSSDVLLTMLQFVPIGVPLHTVITSHSSIAPLVKYKYWFVPRDVLHVHPKALVKLLDANSWLRRPEALTVIYDCHVTRSHRPSSTVLLLTLLRYFPHLRGDAIRLQSFFRCHVLLQNNGYIMKQILRRHLALPSQYRLWFGQSFRSQSRAVFRALSAALFGRAFARIAILQSIVL